MVPSSLHARTTSLHRHLVSVRCSRPVPPPSCGIAPGGPRPCRATQPFSPRCCTSICSLPSLPSPPLCLLPALLVLFPRSVCSPLVVSAPRLYLARPHVPQGLRPVFRPVGRPGRPPQTPLRGDSPVVLSRRPPLHQFPDGRAGRPVRPYAGHRHGASLRETLCSFAPSLAPCAPHLPRPASCVSARPAVVFLLCSRFLLLPRALRVTSALLRVTLVPLPCTPSLACLPSHSPSRSRPCLHVCPPCPFIAVTRVCHSCALLLPLPLAPTLSPGCSLGPRLSPHPGCLAPCVGGGGSQLVRSVPATELQPRLPHDPHRLLSSITVRVSQTALCSSSLPSSLDGVGVGLLLQGSGPCQLRTEVGA